MSLYNKCLSPFTSPFTAQCYCFHTATNHKTNLARCFDCKKNFNPIDLVMAVGKYDFIEAVEYLKAKLS
jgi:hypothetical protein